MESEIRYDVTDYGEAGKEPGACDLILRIFLSIA